MLDVNAVRGVFIRMIFMARIQRPMRLVKWLWRKYFHVNTFINRQTSEIRAAYTHKWFRLIQPYFRNPMYHKITLLKVATRKETEGREGRELFTCEWPCVGRWSVRECFYRFPIYEFIIIIIERVDINGRFVRAVKYRASGNISDE